MFYLQDLRYAWRQLTRSLSFTIATAQVLGSNAVVRASAR